MLKSINSKNILHLVGKRPQEVTLYTSQTPCKHHVRSQLVFKLSARKQKYCDVTLCWQEVLLELRKTPCGSVEHRVDLFQFAHMVDTAIVNSVYVIPLTVLATLLLISTGLRTYLIVNLFFFLEKSEDRRS